MKTCTVETIKRLAAFLSGRADDTTGTNLKLSTSEAVMLLAFVAAELPDLWRREAWPELCDHLQAVTLDANKCFRPLQFAVRGAGDAALNAIYTYDNSTGHWLSPEGHRMTLSADGWRLENEDSDLGTRYERLDADPEGTWSVAAGAVPAPTVVGLMGEILVVREGSDPRISTASQRVEWTDLGDRVNVISGQGTVWVEWQSAPPDLLDAATVGADVNDYELPERFKLALAARGAALLMADEDLARAGALRGMAESDLTKQASRLKIPWWRK